MQLDVCINIFYSDIVIPRLKYRAGRKPQAVRTAATAVLWAILSSGSLGREGTLEALNEIKQALIRLSEDSRSEKVKAYIHLYIQFLRVAVTLASFRSVLSLSVATLAFSNCAGPRCPGRLSETPAKVCI